MIDGVWTTGSFFAFLGGAISMYQPMKNFSRINPVIQQAAAGAERIFVLLDEPPDIEDHPHAKTMETFKDTIAFNHVYFAYDKRENVLKDVSFKINKGDSIAFVGPSGAGKTTLVNLLLRFYDPQGGSITIDGIDVRDLTIFSVRNHISIVTQDILLFNESVKYNVAYGRENATDDEIIQACMLANAHSFIMNLPQGYSTGIGERGILLSGGQKQRLSIARAIVRNPDILILDEATSSLDAESERLVQEAMDRIMKDRTVMVIAHRLATVKKVDRIFVIDKGTIVEAGPHKELFKKEGMYKKLYELQLLT